MKCYERCECAIPDDSDNTYYECNYGTCCGYKCRICGSWLIAKENIDCSVPEEQR